MNINFEHIFICHRCYHIWKQLVHSYSEYITQLLFLVFTNDLFSFQEQLDLRMKEDGGDNKPRHYFHVFYERCQGMMTQLGLLANNVTLLAQAAAKLDTGET